MLPPKYDHSEVDVVNVTGNRSEAESCRRVLTTQMICRFTGHDALYGGGTEMHIGAFLSVVEPIGDDLLAIAVYVKKFIERAEMSQTRAGTRPLNSVRGDLPLAISLVFLLVTRNAYMRITQEGKGIGRNQMICAVSTILVVP